ncbi:MAG: 2-oxoglutarate dehydrogenase E1 component [Gammaproteobacteria bacterium]|nr:2-oxoglutarate dehydrogenase E1 component [Gammaproteobacteria bacterium]
MSSALKRLFDSSYLNGVNAAFLEDMYERYLDDRHSVGEEWRKLFDKVSAETDGAPGRKPLSGAPLRPMPSREAPGTEPAPGLAPDDAEKQAAVLRLINAWRVRGHQAADLDPIKLRERSRVADLDPGFHGLDDEDLDTVFNTGSLFGAERLPLRKIIAKLQRIYGGTVGSEYMHIIDTAEKRWIQNRLEGEESHPVISTRGKHRLLKQLIAAEGLERYLHSKYVGQKRFSLEGGEALIPILNVLISRAGAIGAHEMVIGMAHRGRLNVLVNILGKSLKDLFAEFEGVYDPMRHLGSGDVKYHQGASAQVETKHGVLHVTLAFNPSHLEIVGPVVQGSVRARRVRHDDLTGKFVLPVVIHGDAAFAGQGVVMETLQMSQARGYRTGGTVHIVINNQIGFTTSDPTDARSTTYCTEVAKMVQAPIFHVNGDDPEAVLFVTRVALDYRMKFRKDVVIDLVCYRRHGHNEADEPSATQPLMYAKINERPTAVQVYAQRLLDEGGIGDDELSRWQDDYRQALDDMKPPTRGNHDDSKNPYRVDWSPFVGQDWTAPADTRVSVSRIRTLGKKLLQLPDGFKLHPRVAKIMDSRERMNAGALPIDWGYAETMAYATLVTEGYAVRLSGQDSERGTFFHRHSVLHNMIDGAEYTPLQHLDADQQPYTVINSLLSEAAVLAFEYGFATAEPNALVIWEAQFGDFANGAQVVIDQFISSGEAKWNRLSGLTLFLPHGLEGQGAEHSSARLERFLQLCADHHMQVCVPTTPAQMFHLLRRQMLRPMRRPLVVMTPKSLLRHKASVSSLEELADGEFRVVIPEANAQIEADGVHRLVLCSGKVYYDLIEQREAENMCHIAVVRIEQLHPFPEEALGAELARYANLRDVVWCQEEPRNQGAWYQIQHHLLQAINGRAPLLYAGRHASAAPAVGYRVLHEEQQRALVDNALGPDV